MRQVNIGFTDTFDGTADFFMDKLNNGEIAGYTFHRNDTDPAILFFGDENFGTENLKYDPKKVVKIFFTGENRRWYNYQAHFGITFDHIDDERHYRLPLYVLNMHYLQQRQGIFFTPQEEYSRRKGYNFGHRRAFCGYVQSNPNCAKRNEFFDKLNSYQKIASGGPHKHNIGYVLPRGADGINKKLDFLRLHRFTLAFENGSYAGYATEKLLEAYLAGTVPIYWGSPTVSLDFNPACFLNWHDYKDDDAFLEAIKAANSNEKIYNDYYNQPLFTDYQNFTNPSIRFNNWFTKNILRHF